MIRPERKRIPGDQRRMIYMPRNRHRILVGYYDNRGVVGLLRIHRNNPDAVQFIADMME